MIKVLEKTFKIIEYIAAKRGEPVAPGEIAIALELNHPTCVRILRDLLAMGYLDQVSRQKGYVLGYMAYWVTGGRKYMSEFVTAADPLVRECAMEVKQSVLLAAMNREKRYILSHYNFNANMKVNVDDPWYDDMLETATGRIMLSYATDEEIGEVLRRAKKHNLKFSWPGMSRELREIRKHKGVCFRRCGMTIAAYPLFRDGEFIASLGVSMPESESSEDNVRRITATVESYAKKITNAVSTHSGIG